jgi:hypothetical protein
MNHAWPPLQAGTTKDEKTDSRGFDVVATSRAGKFNKLLIPLAQQIGFFEGLASNARDTSRLPSSSEISMSALAVMHSVNTSWLS